MGSDGQDLAKEVDETKNTDRSSESVKHLNRTKKQMAPTNKVHAGGGEKIVTTAKD